jgi:hypothetical protein
MGIGNFWEGEELKYAYCEIFIEKCRRLNWREDNIKVWTYIEESGVLSTKIARDWKT